MPTQLERENAWTQVKVSSGRAGESHALCHRGEPMNRDERDKRSNMLPTLQGSSGGKRPGPKGLVTESPHPSHPHVGQHRESCWRRQGAFARKHQAPTDGPCTANRLGAVQQLFMTSVNRESSRAHWPICSTDSDPCFNPVQHRISVP
jgi:hypothetical protein